MSEPVISIKHLTKTFRHFTNNHQKLQYELLGRDAGINNTILDDISFDVYPGERVALIGNKGAGITTLHEILAGIIKEYDGEVIVNGETTPYFMHKQGFEAFMTGHENLQVMAAINGISKHVLEEHEDEILEFSGDMSIRDNPIKEYPIGNRNRLGFALATIQKPEILLFDAQFLMGSGKNAVCRARLQDILDSGESTLIMTMTNYLVTKKLCSRGIVIDEGKIVFDGDFMEAVTCFKENYKESVKIKKASSGDEYDAEEEEIALDNQNDEDI